MRAQVVLAVCAAVAAMALVSPPSFAQQKTVRACQEEWRSNRAANEAAGITQKAYVEKCRSTAATAQPAPKPAPPAKPTETAPKPAQKTVRACQDEWRVNRAANEAAGITQKAYVDKCRAGETMVKPTPAPATTITPVKPAPTTAAPPAARPTTAPAARAPAGAPTRASQFSTEGQAKARCPRDIVVWVNLDSKIYHFAGYKDYGNTKSGAYMCERDSTAEGFRAAKNEKHP